MRSPARRLAAALAVGASLAAIPAGVAAAHELGTIQVDVSIRRDFTYRIDVTIDDEHLPRLPRSAPRAGAPGETRWGEVHGLAPDLAARLWPFLGELTERSTIAFDGRAVAPERLDLLPAGTPGAGSGSWTAERYPTLRLTGPVPPGARTFSWASGVALGSYPLALRHEGPEGTEGREEVERRWLRDTATSDPFPLAPELVPPTRLAVVRQYLGLGFTHILPGGLDHILFVLGIFLLSLRLRPVLTQVSAFTLAHTLTLGLSMYGLVRMPPGVVEPLIALSIVYVAVENVVHRELRPWRVALVFAFGLLHGMGFAGVLAGLGLPRGEMATALVAFNAGVEGGQLAVLAAAFLLVGLPFRRRVWYRRGVVVPASLAIAGVGIYWSIERALF